MELRRELSEKLLEAEHLLWSVRKIAESPYTLTRSDISKLRTILEMMEEKLKEADEIFSRLVLQEKITVEVCYGMER